MGFSSPPPEPGKEVGGKTVADIPSTMKAWRFRDATGGAENHMQLENVPTLQSFATLPPHSTLIKVHLVGLNPVDIKFAEVPYIGRFMHPMPATPGLDGVGWVVKTTDRSMRPGQLVMFRKLEKQAEGALAEYVVLPCEGCTAIPTGVSAVQAATVGTCGVTAYQAIAPHFLRFRAQEKDRSSKIFINGGSGGTGVFQIQVAKALGCYVVTSCSTPNVELCKSLGADEVIDYRLGPVSDALKRAVDGGSPKFDLVVDNIDLPWYLYKAAGEYMTPNGIYIQIGGDVSLQAIKELMCIKLLPKFLGGGQRPWEFMAMNTSREDSESILA